MITSPIAAIIIRDSKGDFFVHQRKSSKKTFPNKYGIGAGGHIEENESKDEAAARELKEETGLATPLGYLFQIQYKDKENDYPLFVYETTSDMDINNNISEWQWSGWLSIKDVDELLQEDKLCPDTAQFYTKYLNEFTKENL